MKEACSYSMGENLVTWPHRKDAGGSHLSEISWTMEERENGF